MSVPVFVMGGDGKGLDLGVQGWGLSPGSAITSLESWAVPVRFVKLRHGYCHVVGGEPSLAIVMWCVGSFQLLAARELFQLCVQYWEMLLRDRLQGEAWARGLGRLLRAIVSP